MVVAFNCCNAIIIYDTLFLNESNTTRVQWRDFEITEIYGHLNQVARALI